MPHDTDMINELIHDHREVEEIFRNIEQMPTGEERRKELMTRATIELVRHSVAEEEYLYPAVRRHVPDGDALADKELRDHAEAERIMKELEAREADDPEFNRLADQLMRLIREHVQDEENNLFPRLREGAPAEQLQDLGDRIRTAKRMAPTRPHPGAPDKPPMNKLLAPGAGLVDRARDALTGRGKKA